MYLESEVKGRSAFRQQYSLAVGSVCYDVIIVERRCHTVHILDLLASGGHLLKHMFELLEPVRDICLGALGNASELRLAYHALR